MYFGVDVGRGYTKIAGPAINNVINFPSYVAPARPLDIESGRGKPLEHLSVCINDKKLFMGELARRESGSREFQKEKANHRNTIPLLITAIALAAKDKYISPKLVAGLPISDYRKQAQRFEEKTTGEYEVELPHKKVVIQILRKNIITFPEGAGMIWNQILRNNGCLKNNSFSDFKLAGIDIGWKTCNFAVLSGLQYEDSASGTLPMGLARAFRIFYKRISRDYDYTPAQAELMLSEKGEPELERLAQEITDQLSMWWPVTEDYYKIFIGGGGGGALNKYLDYPQQKKVLNPQIANAKGFYKVARSQLS